MKRLIYSVLTVFCIFSYANSLDRSNNQADPTFINEGDFREGFTVQVNSTNWNAVLPSSSTRRSAIIRNNSSNVLVCLSTFTTPGVNCSTTTAGLEFTGGEYYTDYCEQALYGRVVQGNGSSVTLKGFQYIGTKD